MSKMTFRSAYTGHVSRPALTTGAPLRTQQHHKNDCDINILVKRFADGGLVPTNPQPGAYVDVSHLGDFYEGQNFLAQYRNDFSMLPSELRAQYGNDYRNFLQAPEDLLRAHGFLPPLPEENPGGFEQSTPEKPEAPSVTVEP